MTETAPRATGVAPGYQIATVSRLTGLPVDTIRAWERRYGIVKPVRDASGIRQYSRAETSRLTLAREATQLGHPIRRVAVMSDEELRGLIAAGTQSRAQMPDESGPLLSGSTYSIVRSVTLSIRRFDSDRAERWLEAAVALVGPERFVLEILSPFMREIGESWENGELSIAQEHLASNVVRNIVGTIKRGTPRRDDCGMVLFATPPGEAHVFGIELAACLAATRGHPICVLGSNVPAGEVLRTARHLEPQVVVIGSIRLENPDEFTAYVEMLDSELPAATEIWIGGPGVPHPLPKWSDRVRHLVTLDEFLERL
jgi:methanogenic corrinoid protein MtbC1